MTPLEALKRITKFTEKKIAPLLFLRKEERSVDIMSTEAIEAEYVNPAVGYGSIPHKNFQPLDFQIPCIIWDFDDMADDKDERNGRTVSLRAYVGTYSSEVYDDDTKLPDHKAFEDLLNTLETMYIELTRKHVINGVGIKDSINYGKYDDNYYPYAYGWLTLTAEIERMKYDDEIDLDDFC